MRSVPLGSKRKRGRPAKNRHCLTRSPPLNHILPVQCDEILTQACEDPTLDDPLNAQAISFDHPSAEESNDLFLHLESDSDDDVDILGAK